MKQANNLILCLLLSAIWLSGCVSKEEFTKEATLSRESAYKQWEGRKQAEKQTQAVISGKLTLDDCLKLTLTNNKMLLKTLEEKEAARGGELGAYSAILPSVSLSGGYERIDEKSYFTLGGQNVTMGALDNYSAGADGYTADIRGRGDTRQNQRGPARRTFGRPDSASRGSGNRLRGTTRLLQRPSGPAPLRNKRRRGQIRKGASG